MSSRVEVIGVSGLPEIAAGDSLGGLIAEACVAASEVLGRDDIVVVSQKAVSKAEGRVRDLRHVEPAERARGLAERLGKDPRLVELILGEARSILRAKRGVLIVETNGGWICANAGIDASNVPGAERVTLLPEDPDASARRIRAELRAASDAAPGVLIADSFGRPWRVGQVDVAIGCAGLRPIDDRRGGLDRHGRPLTATIVGVADQLAAAADLVRAKESGVPACVIRGLGRFVTADDGPGARALRRSEAEDLFR
jgi:coenzyme F420-0:L-glutamate ligase/coenzyme F420-1:gamma-L-glutamate ligase